MSARSSTLKELAAELDVSIATVSRALGGYQDISLRTRNRVEAKALEMGYVPNSAGRMLVSGKSGFVGLVLPIRGPQLVDSFLGEFVTGLGEGLKAHGSDLFLATVLETQSELSVLQHVVESGRADGVILNRIEERDERIAFLLSRNFPFVIHGRPLDISSDLNWLDTDGEAAFSEAFSILYNLNHRRFGLLATSNEMTFSHRRSSGLEGAIKANGDPDITLIKLKANRFDEGEIRRTCHEMLTKPNRPTAVLSVLDDYALILMEEAAKLGISVPNDLSIIGFDNLERSAYAPPGLTTFDQSIRQCARDMTDMLMKVINNQQHETQTKLIKPKLISRASHGPAPIN